MEKKWLKMERDKTHFHEKTFFQYIIILLILGAFAFSLLAYLNTIYLRDTLVPRTIDVNDFLSKLTAHEEMKSLIGISPLNIIQVNQNNIANLQTQINGLDTSHVGSFLVQYTDAIVIYNYDTDEIRGTISLGQPPAQLPEDFVDKLNSHPELKGLEEEQPVGGQLDETTLNTLKQQFPEVYEDAQVGDFLLRYKSKLIIYDFKQDAIVNSLDLE